MVETLNINSGTLMGNHIGTSTQTYSTEVKKADLPEALSPQEFEDIIAAMEKFLSSEETNELRVKDFKELKSLVDKAKKKDITTGWDIIRPYLSDGANIPKIGAALGPFLTTRVNEIAATTRQLLQTIVP
jgi:hypothetical protein